MLILFLSSSASTWPALRRPAWRSTRRTVMFSWFWEMGHQPRMQNINTYVCFPSMCEPCEGVILWMVKKKNDAEIIINGYLLGLPVTSYAFSYKKSTKSTACVFFTVWRESESEAIGSPKRYKFIQSNACSDFARKDPRRTTEEPQKNNRRTPEDPRGPQSTKNISKCVYFS